MEKFCISVDWLQTYCLGDALTDGGVYTSAGYVFIIKEVLTETALFKKLWKVEHEGIAVATIQQCPRNSVINQRATLVKLENRVLYSQNYIKMLYALQAALKLTYKGITRLDICYDCNALRGGRDVERFIKQFVMTESGTVGHIIRKGSARFSLHGTRKQTSVSKFNSISWGSPKSRIRCYAYDKTLELLEVKDKPWIREYWAKNGLISDVDFDSIVKMGKKERERILDMDGYGAYVNKRVWRFEISIGSQGQDILNMATGELFRLSPKYMDNQRNIEKLFYLYAERVFCFSINNGQKRMRDYPRLEIFEMRPVITAKPINLNKFADTGRTEKMCYNKLKKLSEEYSDLSELHRAAIVGAMEFLSGLSGKKSSIIRLQRHTRYLDELKGYKFLQKEETEYFAAMEELRRKKIEYDADVLYECFIQNIDTTYWDICRENQKLVPPEDYFF